MAQSDLNAVNLALRLLGSRVVLTALADTTVEGVACNANIDDCKKALLRMHPWNFATKRKKLTPYQDFSVSNVTFVSSQLIEVTHSATTFVAGNYVTVRGVAGASAANGTWEVASVSSGTVVRLTAIGVTTSDILGTYSAGDTDNIRRSPAFSYPYLYNLPSDCLRVLEVDENIRDPNWKIEGGQILAENDSLELRYVADVTDYTLMDVLFYQVLAHYLAYNLCDFITASDQKKNELHTYLWGGQGKKGHLPISKFVDATENSTEEFEANDWTDSRLTGPVI
jgi:hypothetical protein